MCTMTTGTLNSNASFLKLGRTSTTVEKSANDGKTLVATRERSRDSFIRLRVPATTLANSNNALLSDSPTILAESAALVRLSGDSSVDERATHTKLAAATREF